MRPCQCNLSLIEHTWRIAGPILPIHSSTSRAPCEQEVPHGRRKHCRTKENAKTGSEEGFVPIACGKLQPTKACWGSSPHTRCHVRFPLSHDQTGIGKVKARVSHQRGIG